MSRRRRPKKALGQAIVALVGAVLLVAAGVVAVNTPALSLQALPLGHEVGTDTADVEIEFAAADRLAPGAEVRYGERVVGRVVGIETDGSGADVQVRVVSDSGAPANSFAEIRIPTALGSPYVALLPPADGPTGTFGDAETVPLERTAVGPELESSLATLGLLLNGSGIDQLGTVMEELSLALADRGSELRRIRERTDRALTLYEVHRDDLNRAVDAADELAGALTARGDLISEGVETSAGVVAEVAAQRDALSRLVSTSNRLAAQAETFTSGTDGRLTPSVRAIASQVERLDDFGDQVAPTLEVLTSFVELFDTAVRGDHLAFDGDLDLLGTIDALDTGGRHRGTPGQGQDHIVSLLPGGLP